MGHRFRGLLVGYLSPIPGRLARWSVMGDFEGVRHATLLVSANPDKLEAVALQVLHVDPNAERLQPAQPFWTMYRIQCNDTCVPAAAPRCTLIFRSSARRTAFSTRTFRRGPPASISGRARAGYCGMGPRRCSAGRIVQRRSRDSPPATVRPFGSGRFVGRQRAFVFRVTFRHCDTQ